MMRHEEQPWEPGTLQTWGRWAANGILGVLVCPDVREKVGCRDRGGTKSKNGPETPVGSIFTAARSDDYCYWSSPGLFVLVSGLITQFLPNTVWDNLLTRQIQTSSGRFQLGTSGTFWRFCFSSSLFLADSLWPPLSPECCCSIGSGPPLLIWPRLLRKSGRCN